DPVVLGRLRSCEQLGVGQRALDEELVQLSCGVGHGLAGYGGEPAPPLCDGQPGPVALVACCPDGPGRAASAAARQTARAGGARATARDSTRGSGVLVVE